MNPNKTNLSLESLIDLQKKIILNVINNDSYIFEFPDKMKKQIENEMNLSLINNDDDNLPWKIHKLIISKIIYQAFFKKNKIDINDLSDYFYCFSINEKTLFPIDLHVENILHSLGTADVLEVIESFHIHYLNTNCIYKNNDVFYEKSKLNFADKGSVYTDKSIAKIITQTTIENKLEEGINVNDLSILDFGCGTGRFYTNAFKYLAFNLKINKRQIISNNLFAVDIDPIAIDILKIKVFSFLDRPKLSDLTLLSKSIVCKNLLIPDDSLEHEPFYEIHKSIFNNISLKGGFKVIVSNPPYFLLKINSGDNKKYPLQLHYKNLKGRIEKEVEFFRKSNFYKYSIEGMLNYYKLSIEMMLNLAAKNAELGIICPSTLFADLSSKKLRKWLLLQNKVREIEYYSESAKLFNGISQSTVIFYIQKSNVTTEIKIKTKDESFLISLDLIHSAFGENYEIPYINNIGWSILKKISRIRALKNCDGIRNKRGELDLTLHKKYITEQPTDWRLVRGKMIASKEIAREKQEYVLIDDFLKIKSEEYLKKDFNKRRLICQQISNVDISKRLNFVICEKNDIIANSCNYISLDNDIHLQQLKLVLNSILLNWRFKITSSNNHINNYELDELPIIDFTRLNIQDSDDLSNNVALAKLYGLNKSEAVYILREYYPTEEIEDRWQKQDDAI